MGTLIMGRRLALAALVCAVVLADPAKDDDAGAVPGEGAVTASPAKVVAGAEVDVNAPKQCPVTNDKICSGHGACEQGYCKCVEGFTYMDCSVKVCKNGCNKRGTCKNGLCQCYPGYGGEDCSEVRCPNDCSGHGHCSRGDDGHGKGVCLCSEGYLGRDCSKSNCPTTNGAACDEMECPMMCSGHGICNNGTCNCSLDWGGDSCNRSMCPRDCSGHGLCSKGKCYCRMGYSGADCSAAECPGVT